MAGMNCADTLTPNTREMTLEETIKFLEPQEPILSESGEVIIPGRSGAICQSSEHYNEIKTDLEVACKKLGKRCTYEMKENIESFKSALKKVQRKGP